MMCKRQCFTALMFLVSLAGFSQAVNSPYSNNGIGELSFQGLPQNFAMGELGIGTFSPFHINLENPALLTYNNMSSFAVGLEGDFRKFSSNTGSSNQGTLGLRYLALSFPLKGSRWVTSLALLPLSTVNYHTSGISTVNDLFSREDAYGEGGLTQFAWSNGFRVAKNLNIGLKASYIFGAIEREIVTNLYYEDPRTSERLFYAASYQTAYIENANYSDFNFTAGVSYKYDLSETKFLNVGAIYRISTKLDGKRDITYEIQSSQGSTIQERAISSDEKINFELPIFYGFGVSFSQYAHYTIGVDIRQQNWNNTEPDAAGEEYRNTTAVSIGGEYIPNYQSINSYLARATYRLGFAYKPSPYILNGNNINDFGINFGASFPMRGLSSLETGFKFGVRGTKKNNLIRENYFQFVLGATINDRWFIKRRYD